MIQSASLQARQAVKICFALVDFRTDNKDNIFEYSDHWQPDCGLAE